MLRRQVIQSLLQIAGLIPSVPLAARQTPPRMILIHASPVAGFQYHHGEEAWDRLRAGQALDLIREWNNPYVDKAVRVDW